MPINYKIKTHFQRILIEHQLALFALHYTERGIAAFANPKTFDNQLKTEMEKIVSENLWEKNRTDFKLTMTGYFGSGRNKVDFEFAYRYDPYYIKLHLKSLKATINDDISKEYPVVTHPSRDLPKSGVVAKQLIDLLDRQILKKIEESKKTQKHKGKRI